MKYGAEWDFALALRCALKKLLCRVRERIVGFRLVPHQRIGSKAAGAA